MNEGPPYELEHYNTQEWNWTHYQRKLSFVDMVLENPEAAKTSKYLACLMDRPEVAEKEALTVFVGALADVLALRYPEHGRPKPI